ncbi:MAG: hypothetical protein LPK07_06615 [Hymenobacteraceae bacterium]|nr:hypothetical protein [Hymenobacteraceae bacterium]MDX5481339.1 hypothetical protein [Hymenobacteraceae bacterium]
MARFNPLFLLGLLLATAACERPAPPTSAKAETSYNLTAYLQEQKQRLQAERPMVLKSVQTGDQPTETIETDAVNWEDELAVFEEADLNRPALQEYYTKQEQALEDGSTAITYHRREDAEPMVQHLQLILGPDQKLKQLDALLQDKNWLFYTRRNIQLLADPATGNLSGYNVQGVQKLIFGDSLHYKVDANL